MTVNLLYLLMAILGFAVGGALRHVLRTPHVVVTTVRGQSIRGRRRFALGRVVLTNVEVLSDGAAALEGRMEIPRRSIAMVQVLDGPAAPHVDEGSR